MEKVGAEATPSPFPQKIVPKTSQRPRRPGAFRRADLMEPRVTSLELFLPLMKVDLDRRLVTGVATAEAPDRAGEICDYASSKPCFETWSAEALAASGGKSMGAVRAMHGRIAAGKLTGIAFDDAARRVVVEAKIVDDDEWRKVTGRRLHRLLAGRALREALAGRGHRPHPLHRRAAARSRSSTCPACPTRPSKWSRTAWSRSAPFPAPATAAPRRSRPRGTPERGAGDGRGLRSAGPAPAAEAAPQTSEGFYKAAHALADAAIRLDRAEAENLRLTKALDGIAPTLADLAKRVAALEAQPLPPKAALRAVAKSADGEAEAPGGDDVDPQARRAPARGAGARADQAQPGQPVSLLTGSLPDRRRAESRCGDGVPARPGSVRRAPSRRRRRSFESPGAAAPGGAAAEDPRGPSPCSRRRSVHPRPEFGRRAPRPAQPPAKAVETPTRRR